MKCGEFSKRAKERVTIDQQALTPDAIGGQTVVWNAIGTYWAWVRPLTIHETVKADKLRGTCTHKIIIRYNSAFVDTTTTSSFRLTLDGRIHNIRGVKNFDSRLKDFGKAFQELLTDEGAAEIAAS